MDIKIEINQIDNGFVLSLFDADGPADHDENLFLKNFSEVLEKIKEWTKVKA